MTYTVPKHESIQIPVETPGRQREMPSGRSAGPQEKSPGRMLAALILDDDVSWSLKAMSAPDDFPEQAAETFETLIKSLKFENPAKPTWDLGDQWTEQPGHGMRAANLMLGSLEFSVIKLPMRSPDPDEYILSNVNRWRGQLDLPPITLSELRSNVRKVVTSDGHDATVLDIEGMQSGAAMGPMAAGSRSRPNASQTTTPIASANPPSSSFSSEPPATWDVAKPGMMQIATYNIESAGKSAKVSISKAGGDVFQNINRWRGQVSLSPLADPSKLNTEDITVSEQPGLLAEIYGESGQSIVVAMVPAAAPTWFFKLQGDTDVVKDNVASFRKYLTTISLN